MNRHTPYTGGAYHDYPWILEWCASAARAHPQWLSLETYGTSREGRPLILLTLHTGDGDPRQKPAFWLDGGTHASEWAGVMSTLFTLSSWLVALEKGDPALHAWFARHTAYVVPCLSPDGFQHMMAGGPYVRSTKRPPLEGSMRLGLEPQDLDGDGEALWMRWYHPAGPWVPDDELPMLVRPRRLEDPPDRACFACTEGLFLSYDHSGWVMAPSLHGLDLNRNFPVHWTPFSQFGMDGGEYALSEPESRAVLEALHARPNVCGAVSNHTYTGAILTSPYRPETPVPAWDLETLHRIASEAIEGTGYRIFKVYPEFQYEVGKPTPGVWADYLVSNRGIVAYTLELWDPYGYAGVELKDPAKSFWRPDLEAIRKTVAKLAELPDTWRPWKAFDHPQLGKVEIGGLREQWTIRNPPPSLLAEECERAFRVADRVRRTAPDPVTQVTTASTAGSHVLTLAVENLGYLGTYALTHAEKSGFTPPPVAELHLEGDLTLVQGRTHQAIPHLAGWGDAPASFRRHPLNPALSSVAYRQQVQWTVTGHGTARVVYAHPRSGRWETVVVLE